MGAFEHWNVRRKFAHLRVKTPTAVNALAPGKTTAVREQAAVPANSTNRRPVLLEEQLLSAVDRLLRQSLANAEFQESHMIQQVFGLLFVLALFIPAVAVVVGLLSLAVPAQRHGTGHAVGSAVRV